MEENQDVKAIKEVLEVLNKHYPEKFREDGLTLQGVQLMGFLLQLLNTPTQ
mgnify:CR=1 FL=1|jgi:hypothetical protein